MYTCINTSTYVCLSTLCANICRYDFVYAHMYIRTNVLMYICTYLCPCNCTCIHTCMHARMYVCMYVGYPYIHGCVQIQTCLSENVNLRRFSPTCCMNTHRMRSLNGRSAQYCSPTYESSGKRSKASPPSPSNSESASLTFK